MVEEFSPGILATDYAAQEGITVERVYQLVKEGQLESYKVKRGQRERVYVVPKPTTIPTDVMSLAPLSTEAPSLAAISEYNDRLVAPWVKRVKDMEDQLGKAREEVGDLKRQVRELKADLAALQRTRTLDRESV